MFLQQVAKARDGAIVGQVLLTQIQPGKLAKHRRVVQRLLRRRVCQVESLLQEVNARHRLQRKGGHPPLAPVASACRAINAADVVQTFPGFAKFEIEGASSPSHPFAPESF